MFMKTQLHHCHAINHRPKRFLAMLPTQASSELLHDGEPTFSEKEAPSLVDFDTRDSTPPAIYSTDASHADDQLTRMEKEFVGKGSLYPSASANHITCVVGGGTPTSGKAPCGARVMRPDDPAMLKNIAEKLEAGVSRE